jgi:Membrane bound O-acyl transferase family
MSAYQKVLEQHKGEQRLNVTSGALEPFIVPQDFLNIFLVILWLLLSPYHEKLPARANYFFFVLTAGFSISTLVRCRSIRMAFGFGIGLHSAWCMILATNFMILHDPRRFKRAARRYNQADDHGSVIDQTPSVNGHQSISDAKEGVGNKGSHVDLDHTLYWQEMPERLLPRIGWIFDLISSARGIHWSWDDLGHGSLPSSPVNEEVKFQSNNTLLCNCSRLVVAYLCLDLLKVIMISDPYFLGRIDHSVPELLPTVLTSPLMVHFYRLLITFMAICTSIYLITGIQSLINVNILGPRILGVHGESWMYPPANGRFSAILDRGLRGFWGDWWHQLFRRHFLSIGNGVAEFFNLPEGSFQSRGIRSVVAFLLSGAIHACGSYTLFGQTRPWASFIFFALQPVGISLELALSQQFKMAIPSVAKHRTVCRLGHFAMSLGWLLLTFPLLAHDFASGGLWLQEPLPLSAVRGLGFSSEDRRWWCWDGTWYEWHSGNGLWQSGIAI